MDDSLKDHLIQSVFRFRRANLSMRYKDMDLATYALMRALDRNQPGSSDNIYLSEISERLCLSKAALSHMANHMEEKGYLTREINKSNRRKLTITLTAAGHEAIKEAAKEFDLSFTKILNALGDEDAAETIRLFNRFAEIAETLATKEKE